MEPKRTKFCVHKIELPNPFFEKDNNVYVLESGGELALIDAGIELPQAFEALRGGLESHGYRLEQLSKVFVTHKHVDHAGLAARLQELSGATVYVHEGDWPDVREYDLRYPEVHERYLARMREWGLPAEVIERLDATRKTFQELGRSVPAEPLRDGETIPVGDITVRVIHTPGHTRGSACFLVDGKLFVGDHVLPDYTPNIGATDITAQGLLGAYRESLRKIRDLDGVEGLPGHGRPLDDVRARVDEILRHHDEREERLLQVLADGRPRTVYEIAVALFGPLRDHHALLGAGEVYAHLEELRRQKLVAPTEDGRYLRAATG